MKIYRVTVDARRTQYGKESTHLVHARDSKEAIEKACSQARSDGCYKSYDAIRLELVGDAL
jgi:hypothetical protein